jgi:hypothetical protein
MRVIERCRKVVDVLDEEPEEVSVCRPIVAAARY